MTSGAPRKGGSARAATLYGAASLLLTLVAGAVLSAVYRGEAERKAIWISAVVAVVVQVAAFVLAREMAERGLGFAGWGAGAAICFVALIAFGLVTGPFGLPQGAALISLATYFTLTELIEGPFLFL